MGFRWRDLSRSLAVAAAAAAGVVGVAVVAGVAALVVTQVNDVQLVKLTVLAVGAVLLMAALDRPSLALYGVPLVSVLDRPVATLGLEVDLAIAALVVCTPSLALRWQPVAIPAAARWGTALVLCGGGLAVFFAPAPSAAFVGLITWALVLNYALGALGMIARDRRLLAGLAIEIGALGATVAILGWLQGRGLYTIVGPSFAADRIDSSFGYYSNYGNFVALAAVVAVGTSLALAAEGRRWASTFAAVCAVVSGYGAITSLSRGALLCLVVGAAVIVGLSMRQVGAFAGTALTVASVGLLAYLLTPQVAIMQVTDRFTNEPGGDFTRRALQRAGWEILSSTPVGIGFGNFRDAIAQGGIAAGRTILAHSHQLYSQVGLDFGWLGLAGFLLLALGAVFYSLRTAWHAPLGYTAAFAAALCGVLVQGLQDYFFFETASLVAFVLLLTGCYAAALGVPEPSQENVAVPAREASARR